MASMYQRESGLVDKLTVASVREMSQGLLEAIHVEAR
jgi:hypothetical protein